MEVFYRQALAIRETLYGHDSPELISTLDSLARTCFENGEYDAEALYQRLVALWEKTVGKDHPMVAVALDKLVVLYVKRNMRDEARETLARSVAIRAHFLAVGLSQQPAAEISENHQAQAKALYKRALSVLDPPSPANEELIAQIKSLLTDFETPPKAKTVPSPAKE